MAHCYAQAFGDKRQAFTAADLADAIDPRYRAAVILAGYGGLRAGELFGLRIHRVDAVRQRVHVAEIATHVQGHLCVGPPKARASDRTGVDPPLRGGRAGGAHRLDWR
jgi:integrase